MAHLTPEEQVAHDVAGRVALPGALLFYPHDRPITRELAEQVQRAWVEAATTGRPLVLPDDWEVRIL